MENGIYGIDVMEEIWTIWIICRPWDDFYRDGQFQHMLTNSDPLRRQLN